MTKPAITTRASKGAALTFNEQDANFQNLKDATINITAGTGGTSVSIDLNGNLTLVAGTGVTLTGNNTAKTITINATTGSGGITDIVQDTTPQLGGNLDTNGKTISNALGRVTVTDELTVNTGMNIGNLAGGSYRVESTDGMIIASHTTFGGSVNGPSLNLSKVGSLGSTIIGYDNHPDDKIYLSDVINVNSLTTTQRNALTNPQNGDLFYNNTTNTFQGRANSSWVTLSGSAAASDLTGSTLASGVTASSLTSVGTLTSLSTSGTITSSNAAGSTTIDRSGVTASYANNATVDFSNFSGMVMINRQDASSGNVSLWLCGGGVATKLGDSQAAANGTIAGNGAVNGYTWTNNTGGTITCSFMLFRGRTGG